MSYSPTPNIPASMKMQYRVPGEFDWKGAQDLKLIEYPTGSIRIDPLDDNYKRYQDIAKNINGAKEGEGRDKVELNPLWFVLLDNEYGIQDNVRHEYAEVRPFMRAEPFRYYAGSDNEHLEFMVRFFALVNPLTDVHYCYEYLMALQYPWIDPESGYKYPPPKLLLSLNGSMTRVGYIEASNLTWYSPVGVAAEAIVPTGGNSQYKDLITKFAVSFYMEALLTFTVVGNQYGSTEFSAVHSANKFLNNLSNMISFAK